MTFDYAREKMMEATFALASGSRPLSGRLRAALMCFHPLLLDQVPPDLQCKYTAIREFFIKASIKDPFSDAPLGTDEECQEIADKICSMAFSLFRAKDELV